MRTPARLLVVLGLVTAMLVPAVAADARKSKQLPRGYYQCWNYDVSGFPTLAAEIYILRKNRYAGPGKKNKGRYKVGKRKAGKGRKVKFKGGAYRGWWGYYRKERGTPVIELRNSDGQVASGNCPRARK